MEVVIDIEDDVPVFSQLVEQIRQAVRDDELSPGDGLPSIRQLASDLELNNKTAAKAYRIIERDSVIQTKGYRGIFIHPDARAKSTIDLNKEVVAGLTRAVSALRASGATDSEIRIAFRKVMDDHGKGE